jgi:hypothetical protein
MSPLAVISCALLAIYATMGYAQQSLASPVLTIFGHWLRWALFAAALALLATEIFESDRPVWLWLVTGLLLWPMLETMYTWLAIRALSHSTLPLFPSFKINREGDAWPNQRRFISLRDWLREEKFQHVQSLKADLIDGQALRVSVFNDADAHIRLQVMFLPQRTGNVSVCAVFSSLTQSGVRLVTDNVYLPFGGFYPENWEVERHPWMRSTEALMCRHLRRLAGRPEHLTPFIDDPINDLNQQQRIIERTNTELGFLLPRSQQEEHGVLTWEGRYRVWKEAWLLSYFGWPRRY